MTEELKARIMQRCRELKELGATKEQLRDLLHSYLALYVSHVLTFPLEGASNEV